MLAVVALVLASLRDVAADIPRDTSYVMRSIASCPDEGYFFKREASLNGVDQECFLCFCQDNSTAVCWRRQNRRCDVKHYYSIGQRRTRERRSPISLGEVSIRDSGEFFNRQPSKHCKPLESSFSNGCPPADWCSGCTVCDCDANARWDCHLLSFCPDKNGKKQIKKRHGPLKNGISKRQSKASSTKAVTEVTKKPPRDPTRRPLQKQNMRRNKVKQNLPLNKHKIDPVKGTKLKKFTPVKKSKVSKLNLNKGNPSKRLTGKPLAIWKNILNSSRSSIKPNEDTFTKNNSAEVVQKVIKQFMSSMQKMMKNIEMKNNNSSKEANAIFKRSMQKQYNSKKVPRTDKDRPKFIAKPISIAKANKKNKGRRTTPPVLRFDKTGRIKRQVKSGERNLEMPILNFNGTTERVFLSSTLPNDTEKKTADVYNLDLNDTNTTKYYPVHNLTGNSILLETNKDYITDNKVYEDNNSHKIFYHNVDNLTTLHYFTRNTSLSTPYSFNSDLTTQSMRGIVILPNLDFTPKMSKHNNTNINLKENQGNTLINKTEPIVHEINKTDNEYYTKSEHHVKNTTHYNYGVRSFLHSLFSENQFVSKLTPKKPKRFTILTKIKRIFRKLYHKNNKRKFNRNNDFDYLDYSKFQSKYAKSGYDINELRQKIDKLRNESVNILKTLRKLKGLLEILELNTNEIRNKIDSNDPFEYIKKIDTILKDTFVNEQTAQNLTDDQRIQIKYIKDNVQIFIKSIGRFATILDEVIQIDLHHNRNQNKTINSTIKIHSKYKNNDEYKGVKIQQKVKRLKELMMNYNLLQNKFTRQINSILNSLESCNTSNNNKKVQDNRPLQVNKTDAIETNSVNIIRNIRRLKILADKLKSHNRRKRDIIGDEDALGYVLLLMEYLLRRHVPTNPPVNDGIDFLIEAIKKAPDVEPIKKKVLEYSNTPKIPLATRTARPIYKSFTEDSTENASPQMDENKHRTSSKSQSDDDDSDDDNIDEIYQKFKSFNDSSSEQQEDFVLATTKSYQKIKEEDDSYQNNNSSRRFEPETDNETEEVSSTISSNFAIDSNPESPFEYSTTIHSDNIKTSPRVFEKSTSSENKLLVDTKGNIDWIEENFKDLKQMREVEIKLSTPKTIHVTRTVKNPGVDNLSDITNEMDTYSTKKVKKPNAEELILKKEMSLLNSLDYKDVGDETDSKDDKFTEFS